MGECNEGNCSTTKNSQSCGSDCNKSKTCSTGCEMTDMMMCLANEAWAELMKEKIKAEYEKAVGEHMNKKAKIAADGCMEYWKHKIDGMHKKHQFMDNVRKSMMG